MSSCLGPLWGTNCGWTFACYGCINRREFPHAWERSWHWHAITHATMRPWGWPAPATTLPKQFPGIVLVRTVQGFFLLDGLNTLACLEAETISRDVSCSEPAGLSTQFPWHAEFMCRDVVCPSCRRIVQIHSDHSIQLPAGLPGVLFLILVILQLHYILRKVIYFSGYVLCLVVLLISNSPID